MNKVFKLTIALLCFTLASLIVSCDIDIHHHINESKILGTWVCTNDNTHGLIIYSPLPPSDEDDLLLLGLHDIDTNFSEGEKSKVISFKDDGSCSGDLFNDGYYNHNHDGYWSIINDTLFLKIPDYYSSYETFSNYSFRIVKLNNNRLELERVKTWPYSDCLSLLYRDTIIGGVYYSYYNPYEYRICFQWEEETVRQMLFQKQ